MKIRVRPGHPTMQGNEISVADYAEIKDFLAPLGRVDDDPDHRGDLILTLDETRSVRPREGLA